MISHFERVDERLIASFRATLDPYLFEMADGIAPLGLHWCMFPPIVPSADLTLDGHPPRLHDVDPAAFPRRMWVGGEVNLVAPLKLGETVEQRVSVGPVAFKQGRSGALALARLNVELLAGDVRVLVERRDIVYRPPATTAAVPEPGQPLALPAADLSWSVPTPVPMLFRYSALTFNAHRIHYDLPYARDVEGYDGLLVHGPLQATILLNLAAACLERVPTRFHYRAEQPLYADAGMVARARRDGDEVHCSGHRADGTSTMSAAGR